MRAKHITILVSRLWRINAGRMTNDNRGWEGCLTPRILLLVALAGLGLASDSRPSTPNLQLAAFNLQLATFNLRLPTCNNQMHQGEQSATCPMHQQHQSSQANPAIQEEQQTQTKSKIQPAQGSDHQSSHGDHAGMNQRGNIGMGFDQDKTTHHFRLYSQGGAIEVSANDASDTASRDQIRAHLSHIAEALAAGDFQIPMFVHDQPPPGVDVMKQLKDAISYKFEETDRGGRVAISTKDPQAIEAIHSFLRFQILEHRTGDSVEEIAK
jgi:hypothetical protein